MHSETKMFVTDVQEAYILVVEFCIVSGEVKLAVLFLYASIILDNNLQDVNAIYHNR